MAMGLVTCNTPFWSGDAFIGPGAVYDASDEVVVGREIYFQAVEVRHTNSEPTASPSVVAKPAKPPVPKSAPKEGGK
jgi:hypothetical protein